MPPAWFEPPEPLLSEPKLLLLGALDTHAPRVFEFEPAELDALAESAALRGLGTRGVAGDGKLLVKTVKEYAELFDKDPRTALRAVDFSTYDRTIRQL